MIMIYFNAIMITRISHLFSRLLNSINDKTNHRYHQRLADLKINNFYFTDYITDAFWNTRRVRNC